MNVGRTALWTSVFLFALGAVSRLAPLFDAGGRLFRQFPSEDGYLMLTIARNIALGKGMSVSDGLQPTNGTQPLATLLWAAAFRVTHGDRASGVLLILAVQAAVSFAAAWLLFALAQRLFRPWPYGTAISLAVSAAWFASPLVVTHSMNCLESGLYVTLVIAVALAFVESLSPARWSLARCLALGALLGAAFWARNDAVFLVLAACLLHSGWSFVDPAKPLSRRLRETLVFGAASVLVALPWLAFNQLRFGAIVPVSGQSEALEAKFAENLWRAPIAVFEYLTLYLPIPNALEESWTAIAAGLAALLVTIVIVVRVARSGTPTARAVAVLGAIYGACLLLFYGLHFGAGYFFSRYVFPLSPLFALLAAGALAAAWPRAGRRLLPFAAVLLCALALALDLRLYSKGSSHMHFQVVEWVQEHVPEDAWVAAPQSGTLGFFHDRTINLDGKVNPTALAARKRDGNTTHYVVEQRQIEYLADWQGIASWESQPQIAAEFELLVDDPGRNLAVLRRRGAGRS